MKRAAAIAGSFLGASTLAVASAVQFFPDSFVSAGFYRVRSE